MTQEITQKTNCFSRVGRALGHNLLLILIIGLVIDAACAGLLFWHYSAQPIVENISLDSSAQIDKNLLESFLDKAKQRADVAQSAGQETFRDIFSAGYSSSQENEATTTGY